MGLDISSFKDLEEKHVVAQDSSSGDITIFVAGIQKGFPNILKFSIKAIFTNSYNDNLASVEKTLEIDIRNAVAMKFTTFAGVVEVA